MGIMSQLDITVMGMNRVNRNIARYHGEPSTRVKTNHRKEKEAGDRVMDNEK